MLVMVGRSDMMGVVVVGSGNGASCVFFCDDVNWCCDVCVEVRVAGVWLVWYGVV